MVFDRKQWTLDTLIADVKNNRISKSQAQIWVNNYYDKNFFDDTDIIKFAEATSEPKFVEITEEDITE